MTSPADPYGQPQYGQSGQPQFHQPQYGQPQYGQPQYGQPQYGMQPYAPYGTPPGYGAAPVGPARPSVGFVRALVLAFKNAFVFHGRASSSEFWWTYLWGVLLGILAVVLYVALVVTGVMAVSGDSSGSVNPGAVGLGWVLTAALAVSVLAIIALSIVSISLSVRRLHDTNQSGWLILLGFINLILPPVGSIILIVMQAQASNPAGARFDDPSGAQPAV